jgi:hypothetical protein
MEEQPTAGYARGEIMLRKLKVELRKAGEL